MAVVDREPVPVVPDVDPRDIVTETAFKVRPELLGVPIASPWRRLAAFGIDSFLATVVNGLGGAGIASAVLAFLAFRLMTRGSQGCFGVLLKGTVALPLSLLVFALSFSLLEERDIEVNLDSSDVATIVPGESDRDEDRFVPDAISYGEIEDGKRAELAPLKPSSPRDRTAESIEAALEAFDIGSENPAGREALARTLSGLGEKLSSDDARRIRRLESENERLREELESPSLLRFIEGASADVGLTFGWIGVYFTLFTVFWNGYTPGKRIFGIRARRLDGKPFTLWSSFERFGGYAAGVATGLLGFAQVFWDANRQAIHDKISGTVVVQERAAALALAKGADDASETGAESPVDAVSAPEPEPAPAPEPEPDPAPEPEPGEGADGEVDEDGEKPKEA